MVILAIESSCDDTSAAVIRDGVLLSNVTASQRVHEEFGGVVPELASRAHQLNIVPVVDAALKRAGVDSKDLSAIAFTRGPGLLGSLLVGVSFAKGMALAHNIPLVEVNHLQAHILAHFIKTNSEASNSPSGRPIGGTPSNSEASNIPKKVAPHIGCHFFTFSTSVKIIAYSGAIEVTNGIAAKGLARNKKVDE